jgi:hypothetical protein
MSEKLDFYDLIGVLIPGTVFMCLGAICYPDMVIKLAVAKFPDAFSVIALTSVALFFGQVLQSLASLSEPLLERTWGGRCSERALTHGLGDRYLPKDSAIRIARRLSEAIKGESSQRSKFLFALQLSETGGNPRIARFNALYAHFRVCLLLSLAVLLMLAHAFTWGGLRAWTCPDKIGLSLLAVAIVALFWNRTRQRAIYYVREVLLTAERLLDTPSSTKA